MIETNGTLVLAICGQPRSGKTAFIHSLLPHLQNLGLQTAVIQDAQQPLCDVRLEENRGVINHQNSDWAPPFSIGPGFDAQNQLFSLQSVIREFSRYYDLILVEGRAQTPLQKFWLTDSSDDVPQEADQIVQTLEPNCDKVGLVINYIKNRLLSPQALAPLYGCVLIGGKSRRMGSPKHLINQDGATWLEHTLDRLSRRTQVNVIVGDGETPDTLHSIKQLPDIENCEGPLAGVLSAMRWAPHASWIVCACDLPLMTAASLDWLCQQRTPGRWLVMPSLSSRERVEPLYACYEFRLHRVLERMADEKQYKLSTLANHPKTAVVHPPPNIQSSWFNANSPEDLSSLTSG